MKRLTLLVVVFGLAIFGLVFAQEAQEETPAAVPEATPAVSADEGGGDFDLGMKLYRQRKYSAAIAEFEKVTAADPGHAAAWYFAGYAHYVLKHHQEAIAAFAKAFQADPTFDPRPHFKGRR